MVCSLRRISQGVAALIERAYTWLQIGELAIQQLKGISRISAEEAFACYRAVKALGEEGVVILWVQGEVEVHVAIFSKVVKLNAVIQFSVEMKLSMVFVASKVDWREESD